ncbi:hypothetical protein [Actinomadura formosensis]|uniref:hypothetical protein n=1 Tax=Actinomadura formosensis TaxID=60706 RepID=UPI000ABCDC41|nr:hypothetical protein [Actinomadura formosensis]
MPGTGRGGGRLLAISDLHIGYPENRALVERMVPGSGDDWLPAATTATVPCA